MDQAPTSVIERESSSQRVPGPPSAEAAVPTAEIAECNCPDFWQAV